MGQHYRVRQGGLMRCCLASLDDAMAEASAPPKEGDALKCKYCRDEYGMHFRNGAWEWARKEGAEALSQHAKETK